MANETRANDTWESSDTKPCFYRITCCPNTTHLRIPPAFKHHLKNEQADQATLKGPCASWTVELAHRNSDIYFAEGWQEFARHHSLGENELLVFKYNGNMSFDVVIYDKTGCIRKYQSVGTSSRPQSPSSFTSVFPFFKHCIKRYNVGTTSSLLIPKEFSRAHLSPGQILLRNQEGICWSVGLSYASAKYLSFNRGWKAFADDNSLKIGDVCIFELIEQNTMQVHIFW